MYSSFLIRKAAIQYPWISMLRCIQVALSSLWGSCWLSAQYAWTKVVVSYFWWCSSVQRFSSVETSISRSSGPLTYRFAGLHTENLASIAKLMVWKGHFPYDSVVFGRFLYPRLTQHFSFKGSDTSASNACFVSFGAVSAMFGTTIFNFFYVEYDDFQEYNLF